MPLLPDFALYEKTAFYFFVSEGKMHTIPIHVSGKVALCPKRYLISSNSDYVLQFTFDSEWDASPVKTARVIFDEQCVDLAFSGNTVALPKIPACTSLAVGVFSDSLATTAAELGCIVSVADSDASVLDTLEETQYTQLFAMLNAMANKVVSSLSLSADTLTITFSDGSSQTVSVSSLRGAALLPQPLATDEGKVAAVENGVWTAKALPNTDTCITAWMDANFASYCAKNGVATLSAEGVSF